MSIRNQTDDVILAAGGIIEKQTDGGARIAVIHRPRYGGEWNLPKGKLEGTESLWDTAVREVKEETGCSVWIDGFAGFTHYHHGRTPKFVLYWKMKVEGECEFQPSEEVDQMEWLAPKEARERLTHADEKVLVAQIYGDQPVRRNIMTSSLAAKWSRLWYRMFDSPQLHRLANAVNESEIRLKCRRERDPHPPNTCDQAVDECLRRAKDALERGDLDSGWQNLSTAQSLEIWSFDDDEVSKARTVLCAEASKLSGWRQKAITELVRSEFCVDSNGPEDAENAHQGVVKYRKKDKKTLRRELYQATLVKNDGFSTLYFKIGLRGRNLKIAFLTLGLIVVALPLKALSSPLWGISSGDILLVELTGIFGASFSVASSLTKSSVDEEIPQQILGSVVTWMRPVMGAAAAVVAYLLFRAGVIPAIKADINSNLIGFVIAFVAGFSERFIIGAVEAILPEKK